MDNVKTSISIIGVALAGALFAGSLFWLAVPRLSAAFIALPSENKISNFSRVRALDRHAAMGLAAKFERAIVKVPEKSYNQGAISMYHQLYRIAAKEDRLSALEKVRFALIRELSWRPMQSRIWWHLAAVEYAQNRGTSNFSQQALLKSVELQEFAMSLVPERLKLILRHWWRVPPMRRNLLKSQFVQTWRRDPYGLIALARNKKFTGIVRGALALEPKMLGSLEIELGTMRQTPAKLNEH